MLEIKGIGEKKYEQYGEEFLQVIQNWREENPNIKQKIKLLESLLLLERSRNRLMMIAQAI